MQVGYYSKNNALAITNVGESRDKGKIIYKSMLILAFRNWPVKLVPNKKSYSNKSKNTFHSTFVAEKKIQRLLIRNLKVINI